MFKSDNNSKLRFVILGVAFSGLVFIVLAAAVALLFYLFDINRNYIPFFSTLALSIACFLGSFLAAKKAGDKGYIIGGAVGVFFFLAVTVVSIFTGGRLTLNTLFHFILFSLSSLIGGVLGVNNTKRIM